VPEVIDAVLEVFQQHRQGKEHFINTLRRVGQDPFKAAANAVRSKFPTAVDASVEGSI
jgi:sulfite reductase (NADPH) hemoprotein beta-component